MSWSPLFQYSERDEQSEPRSPWGSERADDKEPSVVLDAKAPIRELLNSLFAPIYMEIEGEQHKLEASSEEPKRKQLDGLKQTLEQELYRRQAKKQGICPIRLQVHQELLDQIIRQCTINCPQRGLLLMRVRDNLKMTFSAYQTLYEGSLVFGNRKAYASQIGIPGLKGRIQELKRKKIQLQNKRSSLDNQLDSTQRSFREVRALQDKRRFDQVNYLRSQSKYLQQFLHNI